MESRIIADAIAVLHEMDGGADSASDTWKAAAQSEMAANPRANVGVAVQHLLRAAWYRGYRTGKNEVTV